MMSEKMIDTVTLGAARKYTDKAIGDIDISGEVAEQLPSAVDDYLSDRIDPETGYVLDNSLTLENAAAQAKASGDAISNLKSALMQAIGSVYKYNFVWEQGSINTSGSDIESTTRIRTKDYYEIYSKSILTLISSTKKYGVRFYTSDKTFISIIGFGQQLTIKDIPSTAYYFRLIEGNSDDSEIVPNDNELEVYAMLENEYSNHLSMQLSYLLGTLGSNTGLPVSSTTRVYAPSYRPLCPCYLYAEEGYKYGIRFYDNEYNHLSDYATVFYSDAFSLNPINFPSDAAYFRVIVAKYDNGVIGSSEVQTVGNKLHVVYTHADTSLNIRGANADAYTVGKRLHKSIKILGIGNSYTRDILRWVWKILKEIGYDNVVVGHGYIGGITLAEQYESIIDDESQYHSSFQYWKYYDSQDAHKSEANKTLASIISDENWDVVIFQQQSDDAGQYASFVSDTFDINDFVSYIKTALPNAKIGISLTWSHSTGYAGEKFIEYYDGDPAAQLTAIKTVIPQVANHMTECDYVVNYGLAIEEGRSNSYLDDLGDEMLRTDKNHLYYGIPSYICGLVLVKTVTNADINELTWYPNSTDEGITCVTNPYLAWLGRQCAKIASDKMS